MAVVGLRKGKEYGDGENSSGGRQRSYVEKQANGSFDGLWEEVALNPFSL